MKLQDIVGGRDSLPYLERYVNGNTRTYSRYAHVNDVAPRFQPEGPAADFPVPRFRVPREHLSVFEDSPDPRLRDTYLPDGACAFPVHPDIVDDDSAAHLPLVRACARAEDVRVTPTASTRTVHVPGHGGLPAHFLKLHMPRLISRFLRRLLFVAVEFSVAVSRDLAEFRADRFAYFPETLGVAVGGRSDGWGFILREATPRPRVAEERWCMPLFSLYGEDIRHPSDPPLLVQLIQRHGADPLEFTFDHVIGPLVETWCGAVRERGLLFSAHAENTLLEVGVDLRPTRIVHRDLDVLVDPTMRERRGLHSDFRRGRIGREVTEPRQALYSLKYDSFMGHHLFDYLAETLRRSCGCDPRALQARTRELFRTALPEADELLLATVHYYEDRVDPNNDVRPVDTGRRPTWR